MQKTKQKHTNKIQTIRNFGSDLFKIDPWRLFKARVAEVHAFLKSSPFISALIFIFCSWFTISLIVYQVERDVKDHNINSVEDGIWWGIVTLSTVGYGDRFPVSLAGRIFGALLIICGVVGIAVVTAKISSFFLERALRERRGLVDPNLLNNHFIICGWKKEMSAFLLNILDSNKGLTAQDLVLLTSASEPDLETLLETPRLKSIRVVKGDFYSEVNLVRVAPQRARKVIILADETVGPAGTAPTRTEADARTVMTAMTLSNIAKGTPVAAEILDSSMDQYLKLAHVNEIVYTGDYTRMLIAMSSTGTGVTNIFHELLSPHSPYFFATEDIPENLVGQTYDKLQEYFKKKTNCVLVGILENSGNSHVAKEVAIRKAQQTPNVAELVSNLQSVKHLKFNQAMLGVEPSYKLKDFTMAIVIENRSEVSK